MSSPFKASAPARLQPDVATPSWSRAGGFIVFWLLVLSFCALLRPLQLDEVLQLIGTRTLHLASVFGWLRINPGAVPAGYIVQWALLRIAGFSNIVARLPSLAAWALAAVAIVGIGARAGIRRAGTVLLLTALTPMLFRYAVEGRPYLPAFCLTAFATSLLLGFTDKPEEQPAMWQVVLYGATLSVAPLIQGTAATVTLAHALFVLTEESMRRNRDRRTTLVTAIVASLLLPIAWSVEMRGAWADAIARSGYTFTFSLRTLAGFLKDLSGGGLPCTGLLIAAAAFGMARAAIPRPAKYLLGLTALTTVCGALASDAMAGYFTSPRQAIYCLCPLLVLAAAGWENVRSRHPLPALVVLGLFAAVAVVRDVSVVNSKEDWRAASQMVARAAAEGFCIQPASDVNAPLDLYSFFDPSLASHRCQASDPKALLVYSTFTPQAERDAATAALTRRGYVAGATETVGGSTAERFILSAGER